MYIWNKQCVCINVCLYMWASICIHMVPAGCFNMHVWPLGWHCSCTYSEEGEILYHHLCPPKNQQHWALRIHANAALFSAFDGQTSCSVPQHFHWGSWHVTAVKTRCSVHAHEQGPLPLLSLPTGPPGWLALWSALVLSLTQGARQLWLLSRPCLISQGRTVYQN